MKLSAPIYQLKRQAKALARERALALHEALDRVAVQEGFKSWSLLAAKAALTAPSRELLSRLNPGDLVLLAARPGHGKTMLSLELTVDAMKAGRRGVFFTLDFNETDIIALFESLGEDRKNFSDRFEFDNSDAISAGYIIQQLTDAPAGTVVVVDYLQVLDQKRENPELMVQVRALKAFAYERGLIIVFIAQVDRSFDSSANPCPGFKDVRLPNPLDLTLFNKACFLNNGEIQVATVD